ncbi:MAG: NAD(P)-dependent glycerol-3-phosphate dehydrogenase [Verrucomicrobia bacterium]|nr:NAD(P)-dependent glycerol-3-phosphate dehydrogenase [Verrucomicrobiota bacterium]
MKVGVLGSGAWGTALARLLALAGNPVILWGHDPGHIEELARRRENVRHLPGIAIPEPCAFESQLERVAGEAELMVVAVPSQAVRSVALALSDFKGIIVSVTKGIEYETGLTMCGVMRLLCPLASPVALSGPSLAMEVGRDIPTAVVSASVDRDAAEAVQRLFHRPAFRVYTSPDPLGVELGGALKNVVAIAAGVCDGLGFGDNSKAALITRAIVEIRRLGVACGAQAETFAGLGGLGDLTVTCFSRLSRNRAFGERLGRGETVDAILRTSTHVTEGFPTSRSAFHLARQLAVETPIIDQVHAMLHEGKAATMAVQDLTSRESKSEQS